MTAKIQLGHLETQMNTPTVWLTEPQRQELISRMMVLHEKVKKASQMWNENRLEAGKDFGGPAGRRTVWRVGAAAKRDLQSHRHLPQHGTQLI